MNGRPTIEIDVETNGLQWYAGHRPFLFQAYGPEYFHQNEVVVLKPDEHPASIQAILDAKDVDFRAHNSKFDLHHLDAAGFTLPPQDTWQDSMVSAALVDEKKSKALQARGDALFGDDAGAETEAAVKDWMKAEVKRRRAESKATGEEFIGPTYADVPDDIMVPYAAHDVLLTRRVSDVQDPIIAASPELSRLYALEMEVMGALFDAEKHGLPMDTEAAVQMERALNGELEEQERTCETLSGKRGFNPLSSAQVAEALQRRGADLTFVGKTKNGGYSMDAENLSTVEDELARAVENYKATQKLLSTYVRPMLHSSKTTGEIFNGVREPYIQDGRLHTSFNQIAAVTGRMSSSEPNIQNLPRDDLRIRYLVHAEPGMALVTADLSSIELVLFAAYAGAGRMLDMVNDPAADPHTVTAEHVGLHDFTRAGGAVESMRQQGKTFNYALLYGSGAQNIGKKFRRSPNDARAMVEKYHELYPEARRLQASIKNTLYQQGYIKTVHGRRFRMSQNDAYKATNYLVQGTAADMLKISIARLRKEGISIIAAVHDELIVQCAIGDAEEVSHAMVAALTDHPEIAELVPIEAEAQIVQRWSDAKKPGYTPNFLQKAMAA